MQTFAVLRSALRLLGRHWPALFALIFAGYAARQLLLLASVKASAINGVLGFLVFALVPISMLVALVSMLSVMRQSLSGPAAARPAAGRSAMLAHVASVLLPFLAIYASYDYFARDRTEYIYLVLVDETLANPDTIDNPSAVNVDERLPFQLTPLLIAVVVAAVVLRAVLGRIGRRRSWLDFVRAYLEVLWISLAAATIAGLWQPIKSWVEARRAMHWAAETWESGTSQLGSLASVARTGQSWFGELLAASEPVIVVPLAWVAVGCVIYGHVLAKPPPTDGLTEQARRGLARLPGRLRSGLVTMTAGLRENLAPLVNGVRLLRHTGLRAMLLFCLAFVLARSVPVWLWELERLLIGPQELGTVWMPWSGPLSLVNDAVGAVLLICLVASAVEYVLLTQADPADPLTQGEPPAEQAQAVPSDLQAQVGG